MKPKETFNSISKNVYAIIQGDKMNRYNNKMKLKEGETIKAYKGFDKNLICFGFQYKVGETYEHKGKIVPCQSGFHACINPLDVLRFYDNNSRFARVTAAGEIKEGPRRLTCGKITIDSEIKLPELLVMGMQYIWQDINPQKIMAEIKEKRTECANSVTTGGYSNSVTTGNNSNSATTGEYANSVTTGEEASSATTGWGANSATTGEEANSAATGEYANSVTTGNDSNSATTGKCANSATTGKRANSVTTGNNSNSATTGDDSNSATTGKYANSVTTGKRANSATTGEEANSATTGNCANSETTGYGANSATTGNCANSTTTGKRANSATTGEEANSATMGDDSNSVTTGDYSNSAVYGKESISCGLGFKNKAKGALGCWIVLAEREDYENGYKIKTVKSVKVDGKKIKADTFYILKKGKFVKAK